MKYLFITLTIRTGEYELTERVLHTTKAKSIQWAGERYAATFYDSSLNKEQGYWEVNGGDLIVMLHSVKEVTEQEYNILKKLIYEF